MNRSAVFPFSFRLPVSAIAGPLCGLAMAVSLCAQGEQLTFTGKTDRHPLSYAVGETMTFTVRLVDKSAGNAPVAGRKLVWKTEGDDGAKQSGEATSDEPLVVTATASKPGFVRLTVNVLGADGKVLKGKCEKFDGSAGADVARIVAYPEPVDFDAFWAKRLAAVAAQKGGSTSSVTNEAKGFSVRAFSLPMGEGKSPATGFVAVPVGAKPGALRIDARFHSYGYGPVFFAPRELKTDAICLSVTRQGEEIGREKPYYDELKRAMKNFCFRNTASPETTDQLGMLLRDWRALQWAKTLPEWNGKDVAVAGGSMGGYQALAMAALDPGVTSAWAYIPWHACLAAKEKLGRMGGWAPDWTEALGYFDAANLASRIRCPVVMTIGLGDYVCPPSGEMVLFRNLKGKKKMTVRQNMGHGSDYGVETAVYVIGGNEDFSSWSLPIF